MGSELQISSWSLLIASPWRWDGRNVQMHCLFRKKIMGFLVFAFFTICLSDSWRILGFLIYCFFFQQVASLGNNMQAAAPAPARKCFSTFPSPSLANIYKFSDVKSIENVTAPLIICSCSAPDNMAIQIAAFLFSAGCLQALSQGMYADITALHYLLWSLWTLSRSSLMSTLLRWVNAVSTISSIGCAGTTIGVKLHNGIPFDKSAS